MALAAAYRALSLKNLMQALRGTVAISGMSAEEGEQWGFFNRLVPADALETEAIALARKLAQGPNFAHMMTKTMLGQEWSMSLEQAIEAEAQAQAICMQTHDFRRAYEAFAAKSEPRFAGD